MAKKAKDSINKVNCLNIEKASIMDSVTNCDHGQ